jgi:hypothetical protein
VAKGRKTGGRAKGTPNRITGAVRDLILAALEGVGGQAYLERQAEENPAAFMTLLGKVLPLSVQGDPEAPLAVTVITRRIIDSADPTS